MGGWWGGDGVCVGAGSNGEDKKLLKVISLSFVGLVVCCDLRCILLFL